MTLPLASSAVTVSVVVAVPSATSVAGVAVSDEVVCDTGAPVMLTLTVSVAVPLITAVKVSFCATVLVSVSVNTPSALVVPVIGANVLLVPLGVSVTVAFGIRLPCASYAVTVSTVAFASVVEGVAVSDEVDCDTGPGVKVTLTVSVVVPLITAVNVSFCATMLVSVVVKMPSALVVPVIGVVNVLPVPVAVSITGAFAMGLPWASSAVTVSVVVAVPSATSVAGVTVTGLVAGVVVGAVIGLSFCGVTGASEGAELVG